MKKILILWLVAVACGCSRQSDVAFHLSEAVRTHNLSMDESLPPEQRRENRKATLEHRDALVELGYYAKKTFALRHMHRLADRQRLIAAIPEEPAFSNCWYTMTGSTNEVTSPSGRITVWDRPDSIDRWTEFIREYDVPHNGANNRIHGIGLTRMEI